MSLADTVQSMVRSALVMMATPGLQYRAGTSGSWSSLVAVFHADATQVIGYDDNHRAVTAPATAHIKIPDNGTSLAVLSNESAYQVKTTDGTIWTVVGTSRHNGQTFYNLVRTVTESIGQSRGDTP